ncbi:hypothetical protein B2J88_42485 [Rhodococcus sp. SRB_17]|nr:hypothetical protein [Rhodococcus sp. SRB_17]
MVCCARKLLHSKQLDRTFGMPRPGPVECTLAPLLIQSCGTDVYRSRRVPTESTVAMLGCVACKNLQSTPVHARYSRNAMGEVQKKPLMS